MRLFLRAYLDPEGFDINRPMAGHLQDTRTEFLERVSPKPVGELSQEEHWALRPAALLHMVHEFGAPYVKTHCANWTFDHAPYVVPVGLTERALYIFRDPRDVAVSYADYLGREIDDIIGFMAEPQATTGRSATSAHTAPPQPLMTWSQHVRSWTRPLPFPVLRLQYECLLADPVRAFREVLRFFGIEVEEERLRRAVLRTRFEDLARSERSRGFNAASRQQARFFRSGRAGAWREVLTPEQASRIESDHHEVMEAWGYLEAQGSQAVEAL